MLVRSEWSASRPTGPADLKISAGIPSILEDFPELVYLITFGISSIVGGRSRLLWDLVEHSGVHSGVLKCSLHLALMLLFSSRKVEPSADRSGVVRGLVGK